MEMAAEMPAAVIARLLGISFDRATRWTHDAGNTRPGYAAELARRQQIQCSSLPSAETGSFAEAGERADRGIE